MFIYIYKTFFIFPGLSKYSRKAKVNSDKEEIQPIARINRLVLIFDTLLTYFKWTDIYRNAWATKPSLSGEDTQQCREVFRWEFGNLIEAMTKICEKYTLTMTLFFLKDTQDQDNTLWKLYTLAITKMVFEKLPPDLSKKLHHCYFQEPDKEIAKSVQN